MWLGDGALLVANFEYDPNGQAGQKLWKHVFGSPWIKEYDLTYPDRKYEAMAYACRTWGKAAGAWGPTGGSINLPASVNLGSAVYQIPGQNKPGFGEEHSGQFNARIQNLKPFYNELMFKLNVGTPNP